MIFKHAVDRYNIYFAYKPSKINKKIHSSAINFVTIATILLQFNVVFFTALRSGRKIYLQGHYFFYVYILIINSFCIICPLYEHAEIDVY